MSHEQDRNNENQLRFTFIGMLFALTIAEIALGFAKSVDAGAPWYHPAFFHLLLVTLVVATSWVGWARSKAPGNVQPVKKVFSWQFSVLLVDLSLVVFYFILARGAEIPASKTQVNASAENETFWMMIVFAVYLFWDFLTKAVIGPKSGPASGSDCLAHIPSGALL